MHRPLIDRCADTRVFRSALLLAGLVVFPVLVAGVVTTVIGAGVALFSARSIVEPPLVVIAALSIGGVLGFVGYVRAHLGVRALREHNLTATLLCLAAGIVTALGLGGFAGAWALQVWRGPWDGAGWVSLFATFGFANLIWAFAGLAWTQRLHSRYSEATGHSFDSLPAVLLFVALALATAAATMTAMQ
jgi:hypothetical protein